MKSLNLILYLLVTISINVFAQPPIELVRTYDFENVIYFNDIYAVSNGDFVVSGNSLTGRNAGDMMVVGRLDSGGGLIWSWTNGDRVIDYTAVTIIETENGGFLTGGHSYDREIRIRRFIVALIDSEGETIWIRDYGIGRCYAVIELKSGEYVLAGNSDDEAQLILIDDEGEVIWQETYAHNNEDDARFVAIRETDGGVVASGRFAVWVVKVDLENGEIIWSRSHNANARYCNDMTSTVDGGFVMALSRVGGGSNFGLFKVNEDGDEVWNRSYELEGNNNANFASGVTRLDDGGFAIVGRRIDEGDRPVVVRTNSRGNERWIQTYYLEEWEEFEGPGFFYGVTRGLDGSIIAAGWAVMTDENQRFHALLMKLEQYIPEPVIFDWSPEDTVFSVLPGDTITFMAVARDQQGDELSNLWIVNEDTLGTDTTETIIFEELGEYYVQCQISDEENTATIGWRVTAEEFYLDRFSPDSLVWTIQRNTEVDFSLGVRVIDGFEPVYSWTLTDREHRPNVIGNEAEVTYNFDLAGNFSLEGIVFLDQVEHLVRWQIEVNSVLWWWRPHETEFTVEIDEPIEFTALPFNPDSDSLDYLWLVDGEDDGNVEDGFFARFNDVGEHHVTAIVHDDAEVDTVTWTVNVVEENAVGDDPASRLPTEVTLFPAAPNPFNSTTSIRYFLPTSADVRLTVYDSAGRVVQTLSEGLTASGEHRATIHGAKLPAGVYLLRLETDSTIRSMKVVLLK